MSSINIPKSTSAIITEGDINCGRGQLGYTAIGTLSGVVNNLWTLSAPNRAHFYVLSSVLDSSCQLPEVGSLSTQANVGHRLTIFNVSPTANITVQTFSSVNIFIVGPGSSATFIAIAAPNTWEYTAPMTSITDLQTAYNNGNTIVESFGNSVLIQDNAGFNSRIFEVLDANSDTLLNIGNATVGLDTPYVHVGNTVISSHQPSTIYLSTIDAASYASAPNDSNSQVELLVKKKELYGQVPTPIGTPVSSTMKETTQYAASISSTGSTSIFYIGEYNTLYSVTLEVLINNSDVYYTSILKFTMQNEDAFSPSNNISSLYQESEFDNLVITVDTLYTVLPNGNNGFELQVTGPDYLPPGPKSYNMRILCTVVAFTQV